MAVFFICILFVFCIANFVLIIIEMGAIAATNRKTQELEEEILKLKKRLVRIEKCHVFRCGLGDYIEPYYTHNPEIKTDSIPNVTLDELARFVIDGEPIKRKQKVDVEYREGE